ncbi:class IV adenylate cyclase [Ornatilinea apprima]|uniref:class IV adenylate cyclase n=1 Tax=Ornatilinea apprima TaxID=1134406 RepID=UPI0009462DBA|nr:class IV adenylate cyclase [Ornatilinea apprima]
MNNQEIEVKFFVRDLSEIAQRITEMGGRLVHSRMYEVNLRYEKGDRELYKRMEVLRLRKDFASRLTFKGPYQEDPSVSRRVEIEFEVSNFDNAKKFLEALGYHLDVMYEKNRTTYAIRNVLVVLDEMPYGSFLEIEGPDAESIQQVARDLNLKWEARCTESYIMLFDRLVAKKGLTAKHLSFEEFEGLSFVAEDFDLEFAD